MNKNPQLELPIAAPNAEPSPAGDAAPAPPSPVIRAQRPKRSQFSLLLIAVGVAGIGSLMMLASTRSATTPSVEVPRENRLATATSGNARTEAAKETSVAPMRTSAPRWVASGPSRRAGTGVMFELAADEDVDVWRKRVRPVLTVRCSAKETEVFVLTQSAASIEPTGQHTVQVTFDSGGATAEMWEHSVDHDALFAPNAKGLLHQIADAQRMSFTFSPFNAPPALVHFSVAGFEEQLTSATKTCGWKR